MAKKKREKIMAFSCMVCDVKRHHADFSTCEIIQEHIRVSVPRKRDPDLTGTCDVCYTKAMRESLPGRGVWKVIKQFFGRKD